MLVTVIAIMFFHATAKAETAESLECMDTVCFDKSKVIGGQNVPLRGVGLLEYLKLNMYTGALYVPEEVRTIDEVLGDVPKSLVLHYHRGIKIKWMLQGAEKTLRKNPGVDMAKIRERVDQISAAYVKVSKSDRYELRYEPGKGTTLLLNGKAQTTVPGADFAAAYLGIWLSRYSVNQNFRDQLLGSK